MSPPLSLQFQYRKSTGFATQHEVVAYEGKRLVGSMRWNPTEITGIDVKSSDRRRGVGTALWHEGHRLAAADDMVHEPRHSKDRTPEGDAWARAVGGPIPERRNK